MLDGRILRRAQHLRRRLTPPEARLWINLRRRYVGTLRFRRQHPLGPYILDFYCPEARLAVEVDGEGHGMGDHPARDARRDAYCASQGVHVLRIAGAEVLHNLDGVLGMIEEAAKRTTP